MNHYTSETDIRELEAIIDKRFGHYFRDNSQQIEYKPSDVIHLLEMPLEYLQDIRDR